MEKLNPNDERRKKLALLSKIEQKLAIAIVQYREKNKKENEDVFKKAEDLLKVKGMSGKKLEKIKNRLDFEKKTSLAEVAISVDPDDAKALRSSGYIKVGGEVIY